MLTLDGHPCDQANLLLFDGRQRIGRMEWLRSDALHLVDEVERPFTGSRERSLPGQPQEVLLATRPRRLDGVEAAVQALLLDVRQRILTQERGDIAIELPDLGLQVGRVGLEGPGVEDAPLRARPRLVGRECRLRAQDARCLLGTLKNAQTGSKLADDLAVALPGHETEIDALADRGAEEVPGPFPLPHPGARSPRQVADRVAVPCESATKLVAILLASLGG